MKKTFQELLELSATLAEHSRQIDDFISDSEHKILCDLYDQLPVFEPASHERATRKDHLMNHSSNKITQDIFLPKFQKLWPDQEIIVGGGNFTTWHSPVQPHTDNFQLQYMSIETIENSQEISGFALLVPLRTDTGEGHPHTITFNQFYHGPCTIELPNDAINHTNQPFDKNSEHYPLLDHVPDQRLYGLSIDQIHPWKKNSAIIWHRAQYHCSGKFIGFNNKLHLIFLLNFKHKNKTNI